MQSLNAADDTRWPVDTAPRNSKHHPNRPEHRLLSHDLRFPVQWLNAADDTRWLVDIVPSKGKQCPNCPEHCLLPDDLRSPVQLLKPADDSRWLVDIVPSKGKQCPNCPEQCLLPNDLRFPDKSLKLAARIVTLGDIDCDNILQLLDSISDPLQLFSVLGSWHYSWVWAGVADIDFNLNRTYASRLYIACQK